MVRQWHAASARPGSFKATTANTAWASVSMRCARPDALACSAARRRSLSWPARLHWSCQAFSTCKRYVRERRIPLQAIGAMMKRPKKRRKKCLAQWHRKPLLSQLHSLSLSMSKWWRAMAAYHLPAMLQITPAFHQHWAWSLCWAWPMFKLPLWKCTRCPATLTLPSLLLQTRTQCCMRTLCVSCRQGLPPGVRVTPPVPLELALRPTFIVRVHRQWGGVVFVMKFATQSQLTAARKTAASRRHASSASWELVSRTLTGEYITCIYTALYFHCTLYTLHFIYIALYIHCTCAASGGEHDVRRQLINALVGREVLF